MTDFKWYFNKTECLNENNLQNVIKKIHWIYVGSKEVNDKKYFSIKQGVTEIDSPNADNFITYENITEEMFIEWVESFVNISEMNQDIEKDLELKSNRIELKPPFYNRS